MPVTSAPRGVASGSSPRSATLLTGLGLDEAVTFSLVDESLAAPGPARRGLAAAPDRPFQPEARDRAAAEPDPQPAVGPAAQRGPRQARRRALRDRQRLPAPRRSAAPRRADPAGPRLRPRFPGPQGIVEALLARLHVAEPLAARPVEISPSSPPAGPPSCSSARRISGYLGEVDAGQLAAFELRAGVHGRRARVQRPARARPGSSPSITPCRRSPPSSATSPWWSPGRSPGPSSRPRSSRPPARRLPPSSISTPSRAATSPTISRASISA